LTSATNTWNAIYKIVSGNTKYTTHMTTLRLQDDSLTTNIQDTLLHMIQKFAPDDNQEDDSEIHSQTRNLTHKPPDSEGDEEFTPQEVTQNMGNKKAPGGDGIPNEVWKCVSAILSRYLTAVYNGCVREGVFPKRWKKASIIHTVKPDKEGSDEVSKFRPISLIYSGGKMLEKLLINRINHNVFSRGHMNENQFGFRPQKITVDAALAIKAFLQESLDAGEVIAPISLNVLGAFDAA